MTRFAFSALVGVGLVFGATAAPPGIADVAAQTSGTISVGPTFNKDVLPILQKQCQECHRHGAIAPMSFVTYKETRPYAKAIEKAVVARTMPPWFADPAVGHFKNERRLSQWEIDTLVKWASSGALEGSEKDKPAPVTFADGWTIGKPDIVVQFPHEIQIPATGIMPQGNLVVKANFPRDMWVKAAEVRPGNSRVVHHMKAWIRPPGSSWLQNAPEGELYVPQRGDGGDATTQPVFTGTGPKPVQDILAKYNPGVEGQSFTIGNAAKFIAAGSDIVFEIHYTPTGKPETDRSSVGLVLADAPPTLRHLTTTATSPRNFEIPAGDPNYEIKAETVVEADAQLVWIQPHMHYRGKDFELRVVYPNGDSKLLLKVPNYRFDWQVGYELAEPVPLPKGTRIETLAHYDNSTGNRFNPDPTINVRYGAQTTDEMNVAFVGVVVDAKTDATRIFARPQRPPQRTVTSQ
jgi:hypothetical protein